MIAGKKDAPETKALLTKCIVIFCRRRFCFWPMAAEGQKYLGERNEAIRAMSMVDGKPAAYVCENFTCKAPVTDAKALGELVSR